MDSIEERKGLFIYHAAGREVAEAELSDTISFSKPEERLLAGQVDDLRTFTLRTEALAWRNRIRQSPVRGLTGGRVDLLPHQMFIAEQAAARLLLGCAALADEVGLGKTIEAGLILHRLQLHRARRAGAHHCARAAYSPVVRRACCGASICSFSLFDEERCKGDRRRRRWKRIRSSIAASCSPARNGSRAARNAPLRCRRRVGICLSSMKRIISSGHPKRQARPTQWSKVSPRNARPVAASTATPQQLGPEGHFARLRLLDPDATANCRASSKRPNTTSKWRKPWTACSAARR